MSSATNTRSGNPAKKAAAKKAATKTPEPDLQPSGASDFKARRGGKIMPLPSGLVAKVRKVELQSFVAQGNVPNPLMALVSEALEKGQKGNPADLIISEDQVDLDMVKDMYGLVNSICCAMFLEPQVLPVPEDLDDRDDDLLYVDELDEEDKMFLFQWVTGGTDDVARFRQEAAADMAALAEGQGSKPAAKRASAPRKR